MRLFASYIPETFLLLVSESENGISTSVSKEPRTSEEEEASLGLKKKKKKETSFQTLFGNRIEMMRIKKKRESECENLIKGLLNRLQLLTFSPFTGSSEWLQVMVCKVEKDVLILNGWKEEPKGINEQKCVSMPLPKSEFKWIMTGFTICKRMSGNNRISN